MRFGGCSQTILSKKRYNTLTLQTYVILSAYPSDLCFGSLVLHLSVQQNRRSFFFSYPSALGALFEGHNRNSSVRSVVPSGPKTCKGATCRSGDAKELLVLVEQRPLTCGHVAHVFFSVPLTRSDLSCGCVLFFVARRSTKNSERKRSVKGP